MSAMTELPMARGSTPANGKRRERPPSVLGHRRGMSASSDEPPRIIGSASRQSRLARSITTPESATTGSSSSGGDRERPSSREMSRDRLLSGRNNTSSSSLLRDTDPKRHTISGGVLPMQPRHSLFDAMNGLNGSSPALERRETSSRSTVRSPNRMERLESPMRDASASSLLGIETPARLPSVGELDPAGVLGDTVGRLPLSSPSGNGEIKPPSRHSHSNPSPGHSAADIAKLVSEMEPEQVAQLPKLLAPLTYSGGFSLTPADSDPEQADKPPPSKQFRHLLTDSGPVGLIPVQSLGTLKNAVREVAETSPTKEATRKDRRPLISEEDRALAKQLRAKLIARARSTELDYSDQYPYLPIDDVLEDMLLARQQNSASEFDTCFECAALITHRFGVPNSKTDRVNPIDAFNAMLQVELMDDGDGASSGTGASCGMLSGEHASVYRKNGGATKPNVRNLTEEVHQTKGAQDDSRVDLRKRESPKVVRRAKTMDPQKALPIL